MVATSQKPIPYQSNVSIIKAPPIDSAQQQHHEKHHSIISETNGHYLTPTTSTNSYGVASLIQPAQQSTEDDRAEQSLTTLPVVSNLIKIYSEATTSKSQARDSSISTTVDHYNELTRIVREAAQRIEQGRISSPPKDEKDHEEITWENLVYG